MDVITQHTDQIRLKYTASANSLKPQWFIITKVFFLVIQHVHEELVKTLL